MSQQVLDSDWRIVGRGLLEVEPGQILGDRIIEIIRSSIDLLVSIIKTGFELVRDIIDVIVQTPVPGSLE